MFSQQSTGIFGTIWSLGGLAKKGSPTPAEKQEHKPRKREVILKAIASTLFGSDVVEVSNFGSFGSEIN